MIKFVSSPIFTRTAIEKRARRVLLEELFGARMITTLNIDSNKQWQERAEWLRNRHKPNPEVEKAVLAIVENVREHGDEALLEYTREFDSPSFSGSLRVSEAEIVAGAAAVPAADRKWILEAAANIRAFHASQIERSWFVTRPDGTILGQRVTPVDSAGLYVPGGKGGQTPLVSSLLMNAIPAQIAGCKRIVAVTPPMADGKVSPHLLAAAHLLDIDEVYRVGGAWSIAALALGTESIAKTDVIAGPGNIYVTTAKRLLQGTVGIDMIAGPSEVLIIADSTANPAWIAADMLSQAEHDTLASAICLTNDARLCEVLPQELEAQLAKLPRGEIARESLDKWGCIALCPNISTCIAIANLVAPEHLELCCRDPWEIMTRIRHAGAIFLGSNSPEPVGDYFAGPNHVLPTLGTARFSSALSVRTFCKSTSLIAASRSFVRRNMDAIAALARMEGLEAHARSVEIRRQTTGDYGC